MASSGHSCLPSACCAAMQHPTASAADLNTAKKLSPSVPSSSPWFLAMADRMIVRCADSASA